MASPVGRDPHSSRELVETPIEYEFGGAVAVSMRTQNQGPRRLYQPPWPKESTNYFGFDRGALKIGLLDPISCASNAFLWRMLMPSESTYSSR